MINKKSIVSIAIGSVFAITLSTVPISMAFENKGLMVAESHQTSQEKRSGQDQGEKHGKGHEDEGGKHRHGQEKGKERGHGGHKEKEGKDDHDKHGDKKHGGMTKHGHDYAHLIIPHADKLKLSDEQLGKITRLHLKHEQAHEKLKQKLHKSMKTFKKNSMKPGTSDAQLRELGKELAAAFNEMIEFHIKERQAVHAILSDDQKNQLKTMKIEHDAHNDKHDGHDGHGKHGGSGGHGGDSGHSGHGGSGGSGGHSGHGGHGADKGHGGHDRDSGHSNH